MASGKGLGLAASVALAALAVPVLGQNKGKFPEDQGKKGSAIYAQNCSPCHGPRMLDPQGPFDLRKFPTTEKDRFILSVTKGKNQMPPWGDLFKAEELDALWAYVAAGER